MTDDGGEQDIKTYCALCIARCGAIASVENGRFASLSPDPTHPTGRAVCAKGRAAPELVYNPDRLLYPMKRTRPKGDPDPGWVRIGWDEALQLTADAIKKTAAEHGPEAVAFTQSSPSTTSLSDSAAWIRRLMNAIGTPNTAGNIELCGWGRAYATSYSFGGPSVGVGPGVGAMCDIENAGCLILWGYNPSMTRLTHGTMAAQAVKRGMRLIVVDPRHVGLASKADCWLRVRPGTDGALALGLANIMIEKGSYDRDFILRWSNGPMLVRTDENRLLTEKGLVADGSDTRLCVWNTVAGQVALYDPQSGGYESVGVTPALEGLFQVETVTGPVEVRPVFDMYAALCREYTPERVAEICWIEPSELEKAADLIWNARPTAYYAYSGHEQHTNTTQAARAMSLLYALTGSFDQRGGNVLFPSVPSADISGGDLPAAQHMADALGLKARPLGPSRFQQITSRELYDAVLKDDPYPVRALVGFGANILVAHPGAERGREALSALDFFVHTDLFLTPTAALADVVLPAATPFECEALKIGFEVSTEAQSTVQLRERVVPPQGECRSDTQIVFDLAVKFGLGDSFWNGDVEAAYAHQLAPSGLTLKGLREAGGRATVPLDVQHAKYAAPDANGVPAGFATPSRKVEFWSETFAKHGHDPLPAYEEPLTSPVSQPDLAQEYPLVLTSAKDPLYCNSQHRGVPSLRKREQYPTIEMHPDCAAARNIEAGDWVRIVSAAGSARAVARFNAKLDARVVVGQHGWWQSCQDLEASAYDIYDPDGVNYNRTIGIDKLDPISGTAPHKSYLCEVRPLS